MEVIRTLVGERVTVEDCGHETPCWLWTGHLYHGYGRVKLGGRCYQAHRISYEASKGAIPEGLELDHLCCVAKCCNPDHLEPVTREENLRRKTIRRGYVIGGRVRTERALRGPAKLAEHCKHGHQYAPDTTSLGVNDRGYTYRICLICQRKKDRARRARNPGRSIAHCAAFRARQKELAPARDFAAEAGRGDLVRVHNQVSSRFFVGGSEGAF